MSVGQIETLPSGWREVNGLVVVDERHTITYSKRLDAYVVRQCGHVMATTNDPVIALRLMFKILELAANEGEHA